MFTSSGLPSPMASAVSCELAGTAKTAGCPATCDGSDSAVFCTAAGCTSTASTLSGVTSSPMSMSSVATSTVTVCSASGGLGVALVQKNDDSHECQHGQKESDQDDEAIRSLHESSPLARVDENKDEAPAVHGL